MPRLVDHAPAKVNLTLAVHGKRPDGYHALDSMVAFALDAADGLSLDTDREPDLTVTGPFATALGRDGNLVAAAMRAVAEAFPGVVLGHVTLDKRLPVAAGLGGGSADAAALLRLLRRANPLTQTDDATWQRLALGLGSDVPVCVESRLCQMQGRGDIVTPLPVCDLPAAVLVNPSVPVPHNKTAAVFRALAAPPLGAVAAAQVAQAVPSVAALRDAGNDLTGAAIAVMPVIADVLAHLQAGNGAHVVRLSGAGPTCFALFDSLDAAARAAHALRAAQPSWWVVASRLA